MGESAVMVGQSSSSEDEEDVNGEVVRKGVERNQLAETIRTSLWGFGFLLSVIGIWGDGA
jgi:autophagy-related protein 33